ncbi:MAG: GNAT family N-acetyltransferase, partial [Clostridia bacterium]|nr:GNAT family N-acetyltransferase [Clostridia bacterium]
MTIREYTNADEMGWVRCRIVSFLDCSYSNDVKTEKETYLQPSICLVAEENGTIIGLIDAEIDSYDLACAGNDRGAIIWNLAVLPEYRRHGVARALLAELQARLMKEGVNYCEVWTQEDKAANSFYRSTGFVQEESQTWLRCRANAAGIEKMLSSSAMDGIFGVEELVFNAPVMRRDELSP